MTQPHYIDREAVAALIERLRENLSDIAPSRLVCVEIADVQSALDTIEALSRPMEAVAWREKLAVVEAIQAFYLIDWNRLDAEELADAILQALAVIPTHGLGSSATPIPTELSDTAVVAEKEPDQ